MLFDLNFARLFRRIKACYGICQNAVRTQVWIALSVCLLVALLKKRLHPDLSLYAILQILSLTLSEKTPMTQALSQQPWPPELTGLQNQPCLPWLLTGQWCWKMSVQLSEVEAVFRAMKSQLAIRPIWHRVGARVEAHVMVAFPGYCLWVFEAETQSRGAHPESVATAGSVWTPRAGGSVVQAAGWRSNLPAADHPARTGASAPAASVGLESARTTPPKIYKDQVPDVWTT